MRCPKCLCQDDKVIDSRSSKEGATIRRRRECTQCAHRFTTYEQIEYEPMMVIKRDGRREDFSKDKLVTSLKRACQKRPVSEDSITSAVDRVEEYLAASCEREAASTVIGERVMRELRSMDQVAYVRFASIYRSFEEAKDFVAEVVRLEALPPDDRRQMELLDEGDVEFSEKGARKK